MTFRKLLLLLAVLIISTNLIFGFSLSCLITFHKHFSIFEEAWISFSLVAEYFVFLYSFVMERILSIQLESEFLQNRFLKD